MYKKSIGYNFNTIQDIKSHSSSLYNERMAILFYLLDMESIKLNKDYTSVDNIKSVLSLNTQIYKNVRMILRMNPVLRTKMKLDTPDNGIYITDVMLSNINKLISYCDSYEAYTFKNCYIISNELNEFEMLVKDILQYYNYFIRPNFIQKPDLSMASQKYKELADKMTIDQLRGVVGKNSKIDFTSFGDTDRKMLDASPGVPEFESEIDPDADDDPDDGLGMFTDDESAEDDESIDEDSSAEEAEA